MKYIEYGTEFLDQLKDSVHDLYDENKELKQKIKRLNNIILELNDEVKIIEEDKKIEKILYQFNLNYIDSKLDNYTKEEISKTINYIYDKINEIIDKLNKEEK